MSGAALAEPPSPGGPSAPESVEDAFAAAVREAQAEIQSGVERAGLRNDPYRLPLAALSSIVGLFPAFLARMNGAVDRGRTPLDAGELEKLAKAAAMSADRHAADLVRAHTLRTALIYAGAVLVLVTATTTTAYFWGRAAANAAVVETERRLAAAFQDGPSAAATWATLMEQNDVQHALSMCTGPRAYTDAAGRKACLLPMWVEPPRRAAPSVQQ